MGFRRSNGVRDLLHGIYVEQKRAPRLLPFCCFFLLYQVGDELHHIHVFQIDFLCLGAINRQPPAKKAIRPKGGNQDRPRRS